MENTLTVTLTKEQHAALLHLSKVSLLNAMRMSDPVNQLGDFDQEANDARIKKFAELTKLLTWEAK